MTDTVTGLGEPIEVISLVSVGKDEGNSSFNHGKFGLAYQQYEDAARCLSCTLMMSSVDSVQCTDLAVSLLLNIADCALKLGYFQRVLELCSLVINISPNNIKARFRRAKAAMELGLTVRAFEGLTKAMSLDLSNKEIQIELGKVVLLFQSTTKSKRKLYSFDPPEEHKDGALSGGRDLDSHCLEQGSEEPGKMWSLPFMSASIVIKDLSYSDVTRVRCRESNAPDAHLNRAAAPPSSTMNVCPMHVDTNVVEVSLTSSDVVEDGSHSSSCNITLVKPMYQFVNRHRRGSTIKIPKSFYHALLCG